MNHTLLTHTLGFPRIGAKRELKKATEAYWQGTLDRKSLEAVGREIRQTHWLLQKKAGIELIASNDFSFYDQTLDLSCLVGNIPERFGWSGGEVDLDTRFAVARGVRREGGAGGSCGCAHAESGAHASEMTKWFDTNYHYIVPEFGPDTTFRLSSSKVFDEFTEALALGIRTKPVLIGPLTYLKLGKLHGPRRPEGLLGLLPGLVAVYAEVLRRLAALGAEWVQLDEPAYALDLTEEERRAAAGAYAELSLAAPGLNLLVASYFGGLRANMRDFLRLPVRAVHVDVVRAPEELGAIVAELPAVRLLSAGVIDGRNIWKSDLRSVAARLEGAHQALGSERLWVAPSCSLLHVPVSLRHETRIDAQLRHWLAYAEEKLAETVAVKNLLAGTLAADLLAENDQAAASRRLSERIHRPAVKARAADERTPELSRHSPFALRQAKQRERLQLPPFPTTTIGSFPQTTAVRTARASWKKGALSDSEYERFIERETAECVRWQEEVGLDVLVHGEFERNDMVEYFGEQLEGFAFTENGWVQSYGTRCVKPPIIFGDVERRAPMTIRWAAFAQSLTRKPMKGMLTGPVTVLQWSFVRDDQPRSVTARQIALALRDEVLDLERAGIAVIQIDEPALREGLPLRREDWPVYLRWAVDAFRAAASGVRDETQVHTHMCYAEFNDIIEAIAQLDADVITIETSRSNMELLGAFAQFKYPNEIGPGLYDIHSPRIPAVEEMEELMARAAAVLPPENLWVNPDCGLKTRGWAEVKPALLNLVAAARVLRARYSAPLTARYSRG